MSRRSPSIRRPARRCAGFPAAGRSNLVDRRGRQGATVRSIGANALIEMFQVMAELEGLCARPAARRLTAARRTKIE